MSDVAQAVLASALMGAALTGLAVLARTVGRDMDARGQAGWAWAALVVVAPPIGVILWVVGRDRFPVAGEELTSPLRDDTQRHR